MTNEKITVEFKGDESRYSSKACSYMLANVKTADDEDIELYAEAVTPDTDSDEDFDWEAFDEEAYPTLKVEIIKQAEKYGISPDRLVFAWDD